MLIFTLKYAHGSHITKTIISPTQFSQYYSFGLIKMKDKHVKFNAATLCTAYITLCYTMHNLNKLHKYYIKPIMALSF